MEYVAVGIALIALAASIFIKPKTVEPKAATLSDFSIPTAEENRAIPVLFGTRLISGSNVVWYGDLSKRAIKQKSGK
ncbi:TPA: hypothetical protein NGR52_004207 [Vibrio parahaemolyticus]|nr:hypothetical protein [Vibrio parahaemolyticus]